MTTATSADGTAIAYWRTGDGPAIVLVDAALSTHGESAKLAAAARAAFLGRHLRPTGAR